MKTLTSEQNLLASVSNDIADTLTMETAELILQEVSGNVTADGNEQIIYINNAPMGSYRPTCLFVDLDSMAGGDTTVLRTYYRISNGGGLQLLSYNSFTGADGGLADGMKLASLVLQPSRYGIQITLQQTAGVNTTYDWQVFEEG
jgi:hypothetical protein